MFMPAYSEVGHPTWKKPIPPPAPIIASAPRPYDFRTTTQNLGAVTGTAIVSHVYGSAGTYSVTATVTDASGNSSTVSTAVTVIVTTSPTIIITAAVPTTCTGPKCTVTFQVQVTVPAGVGIQDVVMDFGDGQSSNFGGLTGSIGLSHDYDLSNRGSKRVTVTVTDTLGRTTQGLTVINVP